MEKIIFTGMRFCYDIFTKYNGICGRITKTDTKQQYEITVGDEAITLEEGEVVEIPMTLIEMMSRAYNLLQAVKPLSAMLEH